MWEVWDNGDVADCVGGGIFVKIIDMHCDTIEKLYHAECGRDSESMRYGNLRKNSLQLDLEGMQKGDYLLQNFAVFIDRKNVPDPFEEAHYMIDLYYRELAHNKDRIAPVFCFQDIADNQANGKMSALLTIEGGEAVKGKLSLLRQFYRLGVRLMTLTWNYENELGAPNLMFGEDGIPGFRMRNEQGLTERGIEMVQEMERLGMLIDVSHLSDGGFWDVVKHTEKPFLASHSNAAALCNVCRNLTDDMIRTLAERGGVMGLNFCAAFLQDADNPLEAESRISDMVKQIQHIIQVGGIEVCALGSDYDGIPGCDDMPRASEIQKLADALEKAGLTENEIEKICYKNVLRVYREIL